MELTNSNTKKVIALYLPQYHEIPENNKWWGKGFTEWTNTKNAKPVFIGHYQPKIPLDNNYYDLSSPAVMEKQASLARKYGVFGFCYYHYWFKDGKKLLERPIEAMLEDHKIDIPFFLCWANENWSRNWDGGNKEIIMRQDYGNETDWEKHFCYLLEFFKDERYICFNGMPLLAIYKPEEISCFSEMASYLKKRAVEEGFKGLLIISQHPNCLTLNNFNLDLIDYAIKFQPASYWSNNLRYFSLIESMIHRIDKKLVRLRNKISLRDDHHKYYDYDDAWNAILNKQPFGDKYINGAFVDWDNTARRQKDGTIFIGATPQKFKKYMGLLLKKESALDMIVVNAWNEWGEGAYLEPDSVHKYAYLEALQSALMENE